MNAPFSTEYVIALFYALVIAIALTIFSTPIHAASTYKGTGEPILLELTSDLYENPIEKNLPCRYRYWTKWNQISASCQKKCLVDSWHYVIRCVTRCAYR